MEKFRHSRCSLILTLFAVLSVQFCFGWGSDGHRIVNRVAVEKLPASVPTFLRTHRALEEIEYLGPEPDRWRMQPELAAAQAPNHFVDLELADIAAPHGLPPLRFDFIRDLYRAQARHPAFAERLTPQGVGLLPWQVNEYFERLTQDMRQYRALLSAHRSVTAAKQSILYDVGLLGHYVADASEPLHTTINFNGWVEKENPEKFTREHFIHSRFETEFVRNNLRASDIEPLVSDAPRLLSSPFQDVVAYLRASHSQVAEIYRLEKQGGLEGAGTAQSRKFTAERLAAGATMLRDIVCTAWVQSAR